MSHDPDTGGGWGVLVILIVLLSFVSMVATCERAHEPVREGGPLVEALR